MKKMFTTLMMAMMAMLTTSCINEDEAVAYTLEGTWKGNMYISSSWNGRDYDATYSEITFLKDPCKFSSGQGYWVDYYSDAPWDYVANHIDWRVDFGTIYVYFREEGTSLRISDYRLNDNRFRGTIYDGDLTVDFSLYNTSRPYYDNYEWGYTGWEYRHGYTRSAQTDSIETTNELPTRHLRNK